MTAPAAPPTSAPPIGAPTVEPTTAPVPAPIAPPVSARSVGLLPHAAVRSPRPTSAATGANLVNDIACLLAKLVQPTQSPSGTGQAPRLVLWVQLVEVSDANAENHCRFPASRSAA